MPLPIPNAPHRNALPLGIAALALALVPCCPLTPVIALLLASGSLHLARRHGLPGGVRRTSRAAVAVALVQLLLNAWIYGWFYPHNYLPRLDDALAAAVHTTINEPERARAVWIADGAPPAAAISAFAAECQGRYGRLLDVQIVNRSTEGSTFAPQLRAAATFRFEHSERSGVAVGRIVIRPDSIYPGVHLVDDDLLEPDAWVDRIGEIVIDEVDGSVRRIP